MTPKIMKEMHDQVEEKCAHEVCVAPEGCELCGGELLLGGLPEISCLRCRSRSSNKTLMPRAEGLRACEGAASGALFSANQLTGSGSSRFCERILRRPRERLLQQLCEECPSGSSSGYWSDPVSATGDCVGGFPFLITHIDRIVPCRAPPIDLGQAFAVTIRPELPERVSLTATATTVPAIGDCIGDTLSLDQQVRNH